MRKLLLFAILLVPTLSSCALVGGAAAGAYAANEMNDGSVYVGRLPHSGSAAWAGTKVTLSNLSLKPITVDNEAMQAVADVDGATVTVTVSTYDLNRSEIQVRARKYLMENGPIAKLVFDKICADLDQQR
jgi:hypothetical protein